MPRLRPPTSREGEWADRKDRIIQLYLDDGRKLAGPDSVIEVMAEEGFTAKKWEYEERFRAWNVRKNMKRDEWTRLFQERQSGGETIPAIGNAISPSRVQRARRRYAPRRLHKGDSVLPDLHAVAQGNLATPVPTVADNEDTNTSIYGMISQLTPDCVEVLGSTNETVDTSSHESSGAFDPNMNITCPIESISFDLLEQERNNQALGPWLSVGDVSFFDGSPASEFPLEHVMDISQAQYPQVPSPQLVGTSFGTELELIPSPFSSAVVSRQSLDGPHWHRQIYTNNQWARPLPSTEVVDLVIKDIHSNSTPGSWSNTINAMIFLTDINKSVSKTKGLRANTEHSPGTFPPPLEKLLSTDVFVGEEQSQFSMLQHDVVPEARLYSRLIRSVINGFTSVEKIPTASILRFLCDHKDMRSLMMKLLGINSSPIAKSLAENIFRGALESDNADMIKYLLNNTTLIDANETVCHYRGERYTPLEKATMNQSFRVIRLLISQKVDINKSFPRLFHSNALAMLIDNKDSIKLTIDNSFLNLVDAFLEAHATISVHCIRSALEMSDPRLAIRLIQKLASQTPQKIASDKVLLRAIAEDLDKEYAISMIEFIMKKCRESDNDRCLHEFFLCIQHALECAVYEENEELVDVLLSYTLYPDEIYQKAIALGKETIVDLILHKYPGLAGSSTPLITALKSGDRTWLCALEHNGVLNNFQSGHDLGQALCVALEEGNLECATKILDVHSDLDFGDKQDLDLENYRLMYLPEAFCAALAGNFDDIAWKLLAIGAKNHTDRLLHIAVKERKLDFVRAIIEYGCEPRILYSNDNAYSSVLEVALEWGDDSVLNTLWEVPTLWGVHTHVHTALRLLNFLLENGHLDWFWRILQSDTTNGQYFPWAARFAIGTGNIPLLDKLIELGLRLNDTGMLQKAIDSNPSMVKPLLERYVKAYPQGCSGYGRHVIAMVVRNKLKSEWLDMFSDFNLINKDILKGDGEKETILSDAIKYRAEYSLIKRLLIAGSDVNTTMKDITPGHDYVRTTAFLQAIETERREIVELLIQYGADINAPARAGVRQTPLQKAAEVNNLEIVRLLLDNNADVNAATAIFDGATALQFAAIHGNYEMAIVLIDHGARLDVSPPQGPRGRWPLEGAAENGRLDMIQFLWNANGGPFDDKQCQNAMRLARHNGHIGCKDMIAELMAKSRRNTAMLGA